MQWISRPRTHTIQWAPNHKQTHAAPWGGPTLPSHHHPRHGNHHLSPNSTELFAQPPHFADGITEHAAAGAGFFCGGGLCFLSLIRPPHQWLKRVHPHCYIINHSVETHYLVACPMAGRHLGFVFSLALLSMGVSHSVVSDSLWPLQTVAGLDPLSMGSSRQEYWSGLPFLSSSCMCMF